MRIRELTLRSYRVFDEVDLELPGDGVVGIFGPNGAGKSTLLESILFALYGRARTAKQQIRTHGVLTECLVRLVFEHGGRQYEVRRTIRGKNHQVDAELLAGEASLAVGVTEVNEEVRGLLRMDDAVFRASVFAEQKQLDAFSDVTRGKRKEMVLRLLGIRPVDEARTAARREAREKKGDAERLAEALPDLPAKERELAEAGARTEEARSAAEEAAGALVEATSREASAAEAFRASEEVRGRAEQLEVERSHLAERREGLERRRSALAERLRGLEAALEEMPALEEEAAALEGAAARLRDALAAADLSETLAERRSELEELPAEDPAAALRDLESATEAHRRVQAAAAASGAARERAEADLAAAEDALARTAEADPTQPCPTCGRPLGDDFEAYLRHCRDEVAAAERTLGAARAAEEGAAGASAEAAARLEEATDAGRRTQRTGDLRDRLLRDVEALQGRLAPLVEALGGTIPDLGALEREAARAEEVRERLAGLRAEASHLAAAREDLGGVEGDLEVCERRSAAVDEEAAALRFDAEEHARLAKEREEARELMEAARARERAGSDALRDARAEVTALEAVIAEAREGARRAGALREDARYVERVAGLLEGFRTYLYGRIVPELSREAEALFRELTNHEYEDLRIDEDTLAIHIADGTDYFPIERFSGSEADLANLALRVAISTHLSRMSGADVGILVLDEVLASLDAERKDLFVRTMGTLSTRFHQLFVITHAEQVKERFPSTIEIRRVGRRRSVAAPV